MILPSEDEQRIYEMWFKLEIQNMNILPIYVISTHGRIFNKETKNYLPQNIYYDKNKYITISLKMLDGSSKFFQIHRLMMMVFNPINNSDMYEVNHKDGVKYHNWIWNLEWATPSQNVQHALRNNLFILGEDRENSILSNGIVHQICKMIADGYMNNQIVKSINFPENCSPNQIISNIKAGLSWKHISNQYDFSNMYHKQPVFVEDQIRNICIYFQNKGVNSSTSDILNYIGIDYDKLDGETKFQYVQIISYMRKRKMYKNIVKDYNY